MDNENEDISTIIQSSALISKIRPICIDLPMKNNFRSDFFTYICSFLLKVHREWVLSLKEALDAFQREYRRPLADSDVLLLYHSLELLTPILKDADSFFDHFLATLSLATCRLPANLFSYLHVVIYALGHQQLPNLWSQFMASRSLTAENILVEAIPELSVLSLAKKYYVLDTGFVHRVLMSCTAKSSMLSQTSIFFMPDITCGTSFGTPVSCTNENDTNAPARLSWTTKNRVVVDQLSAHLPTFMEPYTCSCVRSDTDMTYDHCCLTNSLEAMARDITALYNEVRRSHTSKRPRGPGAPPEDKEGTTAKFKSKFTAQLLCLLQSYDVNSAQDLQNMKSDGKLTESNINQNAGGAQDSISRKPQGRSRAPDVCPCVATLLWTIFRYHSLSEVDVFLNAVYSSCTRAPGNAEEPNIKLLECLSQELVPYKDIVVFENLQTNTFIKLPAPHDHNIYTHNTSCSVPLDGNDNYIGNVSVEGLDEPQNDFLCMANPTSSRRPRFCHPFYLTNEEFHANLLSYVLTHGEERLDKYYLGMCFESENLSSSESQNLQDLKLQAKRTKTAVSQSGRYSSDNRNIARKPRRKRGFSVPKDMIRTNPNEETQGDATCTSSIQHSTEHYKKLLEYFTTWTSDIRFSEIVRLIRQNKFRITHHRISCSAYEIVVECSDGCLCSKACLMRCVQHGKRYRLDVFKVRFGQWGLRTLDYIPRGAFVCEYQGEIIAGKQSDSRGELADAQRCSYLFDIGINDLYNPFNSMTSQPNVPSQDNSDQDLTIDATRMGNEARYINHSKNPNLRYKYVWYDDRLTNYKLGLPHLCFFAVRDIKPFEELFIDYGYSDKFKDIYPWAYTQTR